MSFTLTENEEKELRKCQRQEKHVVKYTKITVLLLLNAKATMETIAYGFGIDLSTVSRYKRKFEASKNLSQYLETNYDKIKRKKNLNDEQVESLKQEIDKGYFPTCKSISAFIKKEFDVDFTPNALRPLLKSWGYTYKQVTVVPGKASTKNQYRFARALEKVKDKLSQKKEKMYFLDGVHPTHNTRTIKVWCKKGKEKIIKSNTGRKRININGAMNAIDPCDVIIRNDESVNAQSTINLLKDILEKNRDCSKIHLICDNARYYKNGEVKEYIRDNPELRVHFLPTYSPNLNLIERLWRLLRREKLDLNYYEKYGDFKKSVLGFFENIESYRDKLESLMTFKFHIRDI